MNSVVNYGRTVSKNYQSERVDVSLEVLDGWTHAETLRLCKYLVDAALGLKVNRREANKLLRQYYGDDELDIEDYCLGE